MGKMACYNALKARRERHSEGKKWVRGRREPPDAEGDQLRGVRGVLRIKSKIGAGGSHFGLPAPIAVCFTQIKGSSDFAMLACICSGGISIGPETCFRRLPLQRAVLLLFCGCG